ncbi:OLC1v1030367C1 [Oldenlandia corymbosa var. corymbosa]|uniref:OLC1v1030367C1 n=1 Tax=Oldenlandia corymbosa var. corymbosa TaxID=529605 RepID=A0AAV1CG03_OLDCO|nr:OLC1v1030367C1 [Oldenlandia corymbosa var. corymbosa]
MESQAITEAPVAPPAETLVAPLAETLVACPAKTIPVGSTSGLTEQEKNDTLLDILDSPLLVPEKIELDDMNQRELGKSAPLLRTNTFPILQDIDDAGEEVKALNENDEDKSLEDNGGDIENVFREGNNDRQLVLVDNGDEKQPHMRQNEKQQAFLHNFKDEFRMGEKEMLIRPVTIEEVKPATFSLDEDSVAGMDGFGDCFYKACWEIIAGDLLAASQAFMGGVPIPRAVAMDIEASKHAKVLVHGGYGSFWFDNWMPNRVIWDDPNAHPPHPELSIKDFRSNKNLYLHDLQGSLATNVSQTLMRVEETLAVEHDLFIWQHSPSGIFSIKSAYPHLRRRDMDDFLSKNYWHKFGFRLQKVQVRCFISVHWVAPDQSDYVLNSDGSMVNLDSGYGFCIRKKDGSFLCGESDYLGGGDRFGAEVEANVVVDGLAGEASLGNSNRYSSKGNLPRHIRKPTGAPKVHIFKKVTYFNGMPELEFDDDEFEELIAPHKMSLVGKFSYGQPKMETCGDEFQKLGFKGFYFHGLLKPHHVLIRVELEEDYQRCWITSVWSISGYRMRILKWRPGFKFEKDPSMVPIWVSLHELPLERTHPKVIRSRNAKKKNPNLQSAMNDVMRKEKSIVSKPKVEGKQKSKKVNFVMPKPVPKWKPEKPARVESGRGLLIHEDGTSVEVEILQSNPSIVRALPSGKENVETQLAAEKVVQTREAGCEQAAQICSHAAQTLDPVNATSSGLIASEKAVIPVHVMENLVSPGTNKTLIVIAENELHGSPVARLSENRFELLSDTVNEVDIDDSSDDFPDEVGETILEDPPYASVDGTAMELMHYASDEENFARKIGKEVEEADAGGRWSEGEMEDQQFDEMSQGFVTVKRRRGRTTKEERLGMQEGLVLRRSARLQETFSLNIFN